MSVHALVVSGGATAHSVGFARLPPWVDPIVVAADGGLAAAQALPHRLTAVVGDMDSVDPDGLAHVESLGVEVQRHRTNKDATDTDLAIDFAIARGAAFVCVLDSMQGRVDHFMATMAMLASPRWWKIEMMACVDGARVVVLPPGARRELTIAPGTTVSLIPLGDCVGVATSGLDYPLRDEPLFNGSTRGMSNIANSSTIAISIADTSAPLLVIEPGDCS